MTEEQFGSITFRMFEKVVWWAFLDNFSLDHPSKKIMKMPARNITYYKYTLTFRTDT